MNWLKKFWSKLRRWCWFPGFDYEVYMEPNLVCDYFFNVMDLGLRPEVENWCNKNFGNDWRIVYFDDEDIGIYRVKFMFRHASHATHFKLSWA